MTRDAPLALPGLADRTIVVTAAASLEAVAQCHVLLASGATVIAVGTGPSPDTLRDAGTGLPGRLEYRDLTPGWDAVADWIGEHHAGLRGIVVNAGEDPAGALDAHLIDAASVVLVGAGAPSTERRSNRVIPADGCDAEEVAAAVGFLVSEPADGIRGATIPVAAQ